MSDIDSVPSCGSENRSPFDSIYTKRPISHEEARECCRRLINSHFHQEPHARIGIPARPDYDDDLLLMAYIGQQESKEPR